MLLIVQRTELVALDCMPRFRRQWVVSPGCSYRHTQADGVLLLATCKCATEHAHKLGSFEHRRVSTALFIWVLCQHCSMQQLLSTVTSTSVSSHRFWP